ncbi:hypothetical protein ILYODFUR_023153 [Ilyodon furcidens]|uniref:Uncharacterized protein n=1 Tax=Ilyodon furcidens TaxID=33524 RepID=A0ABV0UIG8_9TELE
MCRILTEKYSSPAIQVLLREATIFDPRYRDSMEEAGALDDVKHQIVLEESGEDASGETCSKAANGNDHEPTAAAPTKKKKKKLSDLQNRRAYLTSQAQATFPKRVQADL